MVGKVPPEDLRGYVFARTGADDDAVSVGPAYGEDTAAIELGDGQILVVNSDPISLAAERIGTLGVDVACNDVAASGADPRWLTVVIFLPERRVELLDEITRQLDAEAERAGVAIVGGHSEFAPGPTRPILSLTCFGLTDRYVPSSGAGPGDRVLLTTGAGIEGTAILATDFKDDLTDVPADLLDRAAGFFDEISVVDDAAICAPHATALHDPTEGGLIDGLLEVAYASGVGIEVDRNAIPIREETARLCDAMGVDPLRIFGSGALIATVPEESCEAVLAALEDAGITASEIGRVIRADEPGIAIDGERIRTPVRDDLYGLWE